jgi:thioesterase domain-containing protein
VAFEIAQQLQAMGEQVALLAVLDHGPRLAKGRQAATPPRWGLHGLRNLIYWLTDDVCRNSPGQLWQRVRTKARALTARRGSFLAGVGKVFDLSQLPERYRRFLEAHYRALRDYVPLPYPGRVTLIRARARPLFSRQSHDLGWGQLALEGVEVRVIPGAHDSILKEPFVRVLADQLRVSLQEAANGETLPNRLPLNLHPPRRAHDVLVQECKR